MATAPDPSRDGATVVITHRLRPGRQADYERWLGEIAPLCRASPGHLDWHIVRPIPGLTDTYTVIIRFDTTEHLRGWIGSTDRQRLIGQIKPALADDDRVHVSDGLDFWFTPASAGPRVAVRWKQFLVTWSVIFPLALGVPHLVLPVLQPLGWATNVWVANLAVTGVIVFLVVYVVMPRYTRAVQGWLFR